MSHRIVTVLSIDPESVAANAGVLPGDRVRAVNGEALADSLDFELLANEPEVTLTLERDGQPVDVTLAREWGEPLGLVVGHATRTCRLDCRFCFVDQQPKGLRKALCIKDDDLSLSFRDGNFVTLSNVDEEDLARAVALGLSPLYVSVHATDPAVRAALLRPRGPAGRDVLPALRRLVEAELEVHAQIVLAAGYNDGAALERTIEDLAPLVPGVRTIAVVPVGVTRYQTDPTIRPWRPDEARALLAQLAPWQARFRKSVRRPTVMPSDEWLLLAGEEPPAAKAYDGYPQMENGVGLVRRFLDDLAKKPRGKGLPRGDGRRVGLVTGRLAAPVLARAAAALADETGADVRILSVASRFWGDTVTVTGLLTGEDLADGLAGSEADALLLPGVVLNDEGRFLDGHDLAWLAERVAPRLVPVTPDVAGLRAGMREVLREE